MVCRTWHTIFVAQEAGEVIRFVKLGLYLCDVRGANWREEKFASFYDLLEGAISRVQKEDVLVMSIHERVLAVGCQRVVQAIK